MAGNKYFNILLYPDDESMKPALELIDSGYINCAWINHDKDIKDDGSGEFKKEHIHVVFKAQGQTSISKVAELFQISERFVNICIDSDASLLYLVHAQNPDKAQYDVDEVHGFLKKRLLILLADRIGGEAVSSIRLWLKSQNRIVLLDDLFKWVLDNDIYGYFRANAVLFNKLREEHNNLFMKRLDPDTAKVVDSIFNHSVNIK